MNLKEIYRPIIEELLMMEQLLAGSIRESENGSILSMSNFLLDSPGKRTRPALVILSERAASVGKNNGKNGENLIRIAAAVELIHMASLIHDDVLDKATMRRNKPSANAKWGEDVSIALGDYVYSKAFELIGKCRNADVFECITNAIQAMCEGELVQVCQRDNLQLSKESYMVIIKKKTASLFAACCHAGTIVGNHGRAVQVALKEFGHNLGMAFQIVDDCKDLISEEKVLGKRPGQDVRVGDVTLPLLSLLEVVDEAEKENLQRMFESHSEQIDIAKIRRMFVGSHAQRKTQDVIASYINIAKKKLETLVDSEYKQSLNSLADYFFQRSILTS